MNKKIAIASASLIALGAAHTTFWFYQSGKIKLSIEQAANQISKEIGRKNTEFFYTSSDISGYPLNFTVRVNQPKFITAGGGEKLEISSADQPLVIKSNLIGSGYKITFPTKLDIKQTIDETETSYKLEFSGASPQLEAKFSGNVMLSFKEGQDILEHLGDKLNSLRYLDSGYSFTKADDNSKIMSSEADFLQVNKTSTKANSFSTAYDIRVNNMDGAALFTQASASADAAKPMGGLWPVTAHFDFSNIDSRDENGKSTSIEYVLRDVDFKASTFGVSVKGDVKANGNDLFPFGDLTVRLSGYEGMVDYFGGIVGQALADSKIPFLNIKSQKSVDFKKVLYEVASEKTNEEKDLLLTISREQGKNLFIGQKGLMEVIDMLKGSGSGDAGAPQSDAANQPDQQPQQEDKLKAPGLDLSPAAGFPATSSPSEAPKLGQ